MNKINTLLILFLLVGGCSDLVNGKRCNDVQQTELKPVIHIEQAPKIEKTAAIIYFADGSSSLTAEEKQILRQVAATARQLNAELKIQGHASERTRKTTIIQHTMINLNISSQRALKVVEALSQDGVPLNRMRYEALSDSQPAEAEINRRAEALNRRVEIFYVY